MKRIGKLIPFLSPKGKINCNIVASNGRNLFTNTQGYENKQGLKRGLVATWRIMHSFSTPEEVEAFVDNAVIEKRLRKGKGKGVV